MDQTGEEFQAHVARLVAEGKLSEADAAELLDGMEPDVQDPAGPASAPVSPEQPEEGRRLQLEVSGFNLRVLHDPALAQPQLTASHDGQIELRAIPGGWQVVRHHQRGFGAGVRAVLSLPWLPTLVHGEVSGGSLNLCAVAGPAQLEVSGGNATLDDAHSLRAEVSGGNLKAGQLSGEARLEVHGGNILVGHSRALRAEVHGGNLNWSGLLDSGEHRLEVNGGQARLALKPGSDLRLEAETTLGGLQANFPLTKNGGMMHAEYRGQLGSGRALLNIELNAGQVGVNAE